MTVDELLEQHTPEIAALCGQLLDHVNAVADWSRTEVYSGWHGVGFHHAELGYVVGVFPRNDDVRIVFERGEWLGQAPFLGGKGQTRHVDFAEWDAERLATVDEMLDRALAE